MSEQITFCVSTLAELMKENESLRKKKQSAKRKWENAFQRWSNEQFIGDGINDYGCCGYGSMCDWCTDNSYGRPCVRALNAMCREKRIEIDYSDYDFKKVWRGMISFNSTIKCHWDKERICENGMYCDMCEFQPADDDKPNGHKEPAPIRWVNEYGMMVPYCPSCGDVAYSTERCVFCGQKLLPTEPPQKNKREIIGGHADEEGVLRCDNCDGYELSLVSHEDGANFFGYTYKCRQCGNSVAVRTYRIGASR